jgi:hypothetical protein
MSRRPEEFSVGGVTEEVVNLTLTCVADFPEFRLFEGAIPWEAEELCIRTVKLSPEVQAAYDMASFSICPNQDKASSPEERLALAKALWFLRAREESSEFIDDESIIGPLSDALKGAFASRDVEASINSLCGTLRSVMRGLASFEGKLKGATGKPRNLKPGAAAIEVAQELFRETRQRPHKRTIIKELEKQGYDFLNNRRANWQAVFVRAGLSKLPW